MPYEARTGQPLIAVCAPRAAGAGRPREKDSPTSWAARTPGPARWPRPRVRKLSSGVRQRQQQEKPAPSSPYTPQATASPFTTPVLPSTTKHSVSSRPSCHVGPRHPQGP
ncbi:hypothetical protein MC885_004602 [Smutsia gigantea]|nr:hypothetical protein MC885_004602 [Smutsia gigantea]